MLFPRTLLALAVILALLQNQVGAQQSGGAASASTPSPSPMLPFKLGFRGVIFVFAVGAATATDPLLRQKFVTGLTGDIQGVQQYHDNHVTQFIPEPDWGLGDFITACKANHDIDDSAGYNVVSGALIIGIQQVSSYTDFKSFVKTYKNAQYDANLSYVSCIEPPKTSHKFLANAPLPDLPSAKTTPAKTTPAKTTPAKTAPAKSASGAKTRPELGNIPDCTTAILPPPSPTPTPTSVATPGAVLTTCQYTETKTLQNKQVDKLVTTWSVASPKPPSASPTAYITWQSDIADGHGKYGFLTPFTLLSGLLIGVSLYGLFATTHTSSSSTVTTYPTPEPWLPPPANGYVSSQTQGYGTGSSLSGLAAFVPGYLGQQFNLDQQVVNTNTGDRLTLSAIGIIVNKFVFSDRFMNCPDPKAPLHVDTLCYKILEAEEPSGNPIP
jgi:hypothetical protein